MNKMMPKQEEAYLRLRDAGYEYDQTTENGDVLVNRWERVADSQILLYSFAIHFDGTTTQKY